MKKRILLGTAALLFVAVFWFSIQTSRAGYESAAYESVEKDGKFEIRDYEALVVASTPMAVRGGDDIERKNRDSGFMRLFRFISGDNEDSRKIAMTTPVFMPADENAETKAMQFVVPRKVAAEGVPEPDADSVSIVKREAGRYAVLRFKGSRNTGKQKRAIANLRELIKSRGLGPVGEPIIAIYDPPWTPEPLRRNEVLLRLR